MRIGDRPRYKNDRMWIGFRPRYNCLARATIVHRSYSLSPSLCRSVYFIAHCNKITSDGAS